MNAPVTEPTGLILVAAEPATITFNYEETRAWLETELKKYDVVVTLDTLPDCKKLATELNKRATDISKRRRAAVEEVSAPIRAFEEKAKSLEKMCKDGRQKLLDQVQVFEDETRKAAAEALTEARAALWLEHGVEEEFRQTQVDDLVKLSTLTKSGKLAAAAKSELVLRVNADFNRQQQTRIRLQQLENESYRAGLAAPLTRAHVETFLFVSEEEYSQRLQTMIASELERQAVAEERSRKRFEDEQRRKQEEAQLQARREAEAEERLIADKAQRQAEAEQRESEPQESSEPAPTAPDTTAASVEPFAFGLLTAPASATVVRDTRASAERQAVELSAANAGQPYGLWQPKPVGLVAIVFNGEAFSKSGGAA